VVFAADIFTIIVMVSMVALILAIIALGVWHPRTGAEILDWKPTRSAEVEAQNDIDDVDQMIAAQNALRARRGKAPRTEEEVELQVMRDRRELDDYATRYWEEQGKQGIKPSKEDI
jgi:hypothetical protein